MTKPYFGGFPKITGAFLGVPLIRIIVVWGLYWVSLFRGTTILSTCVLQSGFRSGDCIYSPRRIYSCWPILPPSAPPCLSNSSFPVGSSFCIGGSSQNYCHLQLSLRATEIVQERNPSTSEQATGDADEVRPYSSKNVAGEAGVCSSGAASTEASPQQERQTERKRQKSKTERAREKEREKD